MFPKETALRILQKCLSGRGKKIFRNQVQFYNAIFGVTNPECFQTDWESVDQFLVSGLDNSSSNIGKHIIFPLKVAWIKNLLIGN